jgi:hypothetical protein
VFHINLRINSDYFHKQRQPVYLCKGELLCFLCGRNWILMNFGYQDASLPPPEIKFLLLLPHTFPLLLLFCCPSRLCFFFGFKGLKVLWKGFMESEGSLPNSQVCHYTLPWAIWIQSTLTPYLFKPIFFIVLPFTSRSIKEYLPFRFHDQNFECTSDVSGGLRSE